MVGKKSHWGILVNNSSCKKSFIESLLSGQFPLELDTLKGKTGALFSSLTLRKYIEKEERYDQKILSKHTHQSLKSMSSGEQKKALLHYLLQEQPNFLILDNPFDNLDKASQTGLRKMLLQIAKNTSLVLLLSRQEDLLSFIEFRYVLQRNNLLPYTQENIQEKTAIFKRPIPTSLGQFPLETNPLISLKNISVAYNNKPILKQINWEIKVGEFWQLKGENGSGKTTLLSMITGENSKGYGQDLYIFGKKKGSGESIWDIKKKIGYVTPALTDLFLGYHSVEHMLISGFFDSVGLYKQPNRMQQLLANEWLQLIHMQNLKDTYFHELSLGQQRMVMTVRAMIKHPPLLILDEPTVGLDDESAQRFVALINQFANESTTSIIFVSHRSEPGLQPRHTYQLQMTAEGSRGSIVPKN